MSLGSKIRDLRIKKGLTQSDLGAGLVTPSMISQIESDKANPSYKVLEAIAVKLEQPLEYFLSDLHSQLEQVTAYKVAKALIASNEYDRAVEVLRSLTNNVIANMNSTEAQIDLGKCLIELAQYEEAAECLHEAVKQATETEQYYLALSAFNTLGYMEQRRKKPYKAVYFWLKGYDLFSKLDVSDPFLKGELLNNLGAIHNDLGETEDAINFYGEAMNLLNNTSNFEQIGMTYLGLAFSLRQKEKYELASEYANYAEALFQSTKNVRLAIEVKRKIVSTMNGNIDFSKAVSILEECLVQCKSHHLSNEVASIYCDIASLHIQNKQPELSLDATDKGLIIATEGSVTAANLLRVKGLALGRLGNHTDAVRALEQAIYVYQSHDQKAELSDCFSLLADLHQQAGDVLTANNYLNRMRQVMQDRLKERGLSYSA